VIAFLRLDEVYSKRIPEEHLPRPWVARITGTDTKFGLARDFLAYVRDYANADKKGRGIVRQFTLRDGELYEVSAPVSAYKPPRRYFVGVVDAKVVEVEASLVEGMARELDAATRAIIDSVVRRAIAGA
jgi:hypothetical protein